MKILLSKNKIGVFSIIVFATFLFLSVSAAPDRKNISDLRADTISAVEGAKKSLEKLNESYVSAVKQYGMEAPLVESIKSLREETKVLLVDLKTLQEKLSKPGIQEAELSVLLDKIVNHYQLIKSKFIPNAISQLNKKIKEVNFTEAYILRGSRADLEKEIPTVEGRLDNFKRQKAVLSAATSQKKEKPEAKKAAAPTEKPASTEMGAVSDVIRELISIKKET